MSSAYKILPNYNYQDYLRWEGNWELIDGIPYAMSPAPRPDHQAVATNIAAEFRTSIKGNRCSCKVYQPIDYKVSEDTILNPDILIVCKPITEGFLNFAPELVVEILSPATALKDRHTKFEIYQKEKVLYYLIVDAEKKLVEIYLLIDDGYERQMHDISKPFLFTFPDCSFELTLEAIWT